MKSVPPLPSHDSVEELTEKFSSHFVEKISKLHQRLNGTPTPKWSPAASSTCLCSLAEFNEVSMETVRRTIRASPSKSCPLDPIPTRILKACLDELLPIITAIVNSSMRDGIFPTAFKESRLLPVIKKATLDPNDFSNFRPITNLAFVKSARTYRCKPNS